MLFGALDYNLLYCFSYLYDHPNTLIFTCDTKYLFNRPKVAVSYSTTHKEHDASHMIKQLAVSRITLGELVTKY